METAVSASETGVSTLKTVVFGSEAGVSTREAAVFSSGTRASMLETAVSASGTGVSALKTAISGSGTGVSTLEAAVSSSGTRAFTLETAVSASEAGVSTLETVVSGSGTGVSALETAVSGSGTGVSALETTVSGSQTAVSVPEAGVLALSNRDPVTQIPRDIIPAVVDKAEDASPPFRRRVAALMSVAAHPFILIPVLVAVVTARSLPPRESPAPGPCNAQSYSLTYFRTPERRELDYVRQTGASVGLTHDPVFERRRRAREPLILRALSGSRGEAPGRCKWMPRQESSRIEGRERPHPLSPCPPLPSPAPPAPGEGERR